MDLTPNPEQSTWFDLGPITDFSGQGLQDDEVMHPPFDDTAMVGAHKDGEKFAMRLVSSDGSVKCVYVSKFLTPGKDGRGGDGRLMRAFAYIQTPEGVRFYRDGVQIDEGKMTEIFRIVCACFLKLHACTEAYQQTVKANSLTNKRRAAKGKPPLIYDWRTITIKPSGPATASQGGTHATPRRHQCRGHWRTYKSGKIGWVAECWKGDASKGTVFKDYQIQGKS